MTDNYPEDFNEEIKKMNSNEIAVLHTAYLVFSSKFIEYVREMDTELFKRALDYAATVVDAHNSIEKK